MRSIFFACLREEIFCHMSSGERITLKTLTKPKDIQAYLAFDKAGNSFAGTDGLFPASLL